MYKWVIAMLAVTAVPLTMGAGRTAATSSGQPAAGAGYAPHAAGARLVGQLHPNPVQPKLATAAVTGPTVPNYSDKFSYKGTSYAYMPL